MKPLPEIETARLPGFDPRPGAFPWAPRAVNPSQKSAPPSDKVTDW